jgi:hypothetical protein
MTIIIVSTLALIRLREEAIAMRIGGPIPVPSCDNSVARRHAYR